MDFGDILDNWLSQNEIYDKDAVSPGERTVPGNRRYKLLRKKPDASIDLHGLTGDEAWAALDAFFEESRKKRFEKLLIIHGKGNHRSETSLNEGVLRDITRRYIENCSFAGESGYSPAREGGTGATWVILKEANVPGK